ncbi:unnamed protein product [Leuciscus chuanchicus]
MGRLKRYLKRKKQRGVLRLLRWKKGPWTGFSLERYRRIRKVPAKEKAPQEKADVGDKERPSKPPGLEAPRWSIHVNHESKEKARNWSLAQVNPVLFVGASNLSRLPRTEAWEIEVHSFPGATIVDGYNIIKHRTRTIGGMEHVVLAFGLNDRANSNITALGKMLEKLVEAAKATFPGAKIYVPLINFDKALPGNQKANLGALNKKIFQLGYSMPLLPEEEFKVGMSEHLKGPKNSPDPRGLMKKVDKGSLLADLGQFHAKVQRAVFFGPREETDVQILLFCERSGWVPRPQQLPGEIWDFFDKNVEGVQIVLSGAQAPRQNLPPEEVRALEELISRRDIVIKPADKGSEEEIKTFQIRWYRANSLNLHPRAAWVEDGREGPPGRLARLADQAKKVQPAFQSARTECRLQDNANEWLQNGLTILEEHYQGALRRASREVIGSPGVDWKEAWQVAVKWTQRRYRRMKEQTVQRAWRVVKVLMSRRRPEGEAEEGTSADPGAEARPEPPQEGEQGQQEEGVETVPMEVDQPRRAASPAAPTAEVAGKGAEIPLGEKMPKAKKGWGPSSRKAVATLPALTPLQRPREQKSEGSPQAGLVTESEPEKLVIALEPEAASVYCKQLPKEGFIAECQSEETLENDPGTQYMVVDCGDTPPSAAACCHRCPVRDVRCPVRDVRCPVRDVRCPVRDVRCPVRDVRCSLPSEGCSLPSEGCSLPSEGCSLPSEGCSLPSEGCSLPSEGCSLPSEGCSLPSEGCSLPSQRVLSRGKRELLAGCHPPIVSGILSVIYCRPPHFVGWLLPSAGHILFGFPTEKGLGPPAQPPRPVKEVTLS